MTISGQEDEVMDAATQHAMSAHGHDGADEVRARLSEHLKDEAPAPA